MRAASRGALACVAAALFAVTALGCAGASTVVARVDGDALIKSELNHWMSVAATVEAPPTAGREASQRRTLGFLIFSRWLTGAARELGLSVSGSEARKQLELLRTDERTGVSYDGLPNEPELKNLIIASVSQSDALWLMKLCILDSRIERARLSQAEREISDEAVAQFYKRHRRQFFVPEQSHLEILGNYQLAVVSKARREIESGTPFLRVAQRVSIDPEAPNGLQHLIQGREEPQFEHVIFAAKPHVLVGPVSYGFFYLFEVFDTSPAHQQTLAQAQAAIRRQLASTRASTTLLAAFTAKWTARTTCSAGYLIPECK